MCWLPIASALWLVPAILAPSALVLLFFSYESSRIFLGTRTARFTRFASRSAEGRSPLPGFGVSPKSSFSFFCSPPQAARGGKEACGDAPHPISARLTMYEQYERHFVHPVLTANRCGEHEHLDTGGNKYRSCPSYHLSLALIAPHPGREDPAPQF